MSALSA